MLYNVGVSQVCRRASVSPYCIATCEPKQLNFMDSVTRHPGAAFRVESCLDGCFPKWVSSLVSEAVFYITIQYTYIHLPNNKTHKASLVVQWLRVHPAMQGQGFDPWWWKIPYDKEQLNLGITPTETTLKSRGLQHEKLLQWEDHAP